QGSTFSFSARLERRAPGAAAAHAPAAPALRVLVADDSAPSRELLVRWLADWGMTATPVAGGAEALGALRAAAAAGRPYAALLLDAQMPGVDGVAVTAQLRAEPAIAPTPVVLLGSSERSAALERFRALGGAAHLAKPLTPEDVREAIRQVVERPAPAARAAEPTPVAASRRPRALVAAAHGRDVG